MTLYFLGNHLSTPKKARPTVTVLIPTTPKCKSLDRESSEVSQVPTPVFSWPLRLSRKQFTPKMLNCPFPQSWTPLQDVVRETNSSPWNTDWEDIGSSGHPLPWGLGASPKCLSQPVGLERLSGAPASGTSLRTSKDNERGRVPQLNKERWGTTESP